jgi:copper chaperone CopZ
LEPLRPYFIAFTVLVLGFAWYQKLKPRKQDEIVCDCETAFLPAGKAGKPSFRQSKKFLAIITVFAILMMAFPHYSSVFYPDNKKEAAFVDATKLITPDLKVEGMTCESCNPHVAHAAQELDGVAEAKADFTTGNTEVKFDPSKTSEDKIVHSINATGYKVIGKEVE